tara:strand:+ start:395 stop:1447 length:1053 start_codon:yes stop_codon:yes gene_type:complete
MKYSIENIENSQNLDISSIEVVNDNNYRFKFYTYGGYIHEIHIPYYKKPFITEDVLLGYRNIDDVLKADGYFNSIIGRVANRISNAKFNLSNKEYKLFSNINSDHLHGGKEGFNKKIWKLENIENEDNSIKFKLTYLSQHLEENYPGNLDCSATYEFNNQNELILSFRAKTDQETIVNMTNHNYWNFHGHKDYFQNIENHRVQINSQLICETDINSIPTGNILNIANTKFDLNNNFLINKDFLENGGIDHNYVIDKYDMREPVAIIFSENTGLGVEYYTNQPGIQFYTGNMMHEKCHGKYLQTYKKQFGMCLEPQKFPDAINQINFLSPILNKNEVYESKIKIKLKNDFI